MTAVKPLLTPEQAANLLGLKRNWVLVEARHDRIPHVRFGRYVRFEEDVLLAWARNRRQGPVPSLA